MSEPSAASFRVRTGVLAMVVSALACVGCSSPRATPTPTATVAAPSLGVPDSKNRLVHSDVQVITGSDANHFSITEPLVEIVPPVSGREATLNFKYEFDAAPPFTLGIEGAEMFVSIFAPDGSVVADRLVELDEGFRGSVGIPAGDYSIRLYYRPCDGNCARLDPSREFCSVDQIVKPRQSYDVTVQIRDAGASVCSAVET